MRIGDLLVANGLDVPVNEPSGTAALVQQTLEAMRPHLKAVVEVRWPHTSDGSKGEWALTGSEPYKLDAVISAIGRFARENYDPQTDRRVVLFHRTKRDTRNSDFLYQAVVATTELAQGLAASIEAEVGQVFGSDLRGEVFHVRVMTP